MTDRVRRSIRQGWEQVAGEYARDRTGVFTLSARRLLELLDPRPGDALLDVGTGSGVVLRAGAERSLGRQMVGVDIARSMLAQAMQRAQAGAAFCQMDGERLGFRDHSFDSVTCAYALFQFPDMARALADMCRLLKPGGRLALSNWGPGYFYPIAALQRDLFREFGLKPLLSNPLVFQPEALRTLLRQAGFASVILVEETAQVPFESPEAVWAFDLDMGPFPVMLGQQLSSQERDELERRFVAMVGALATDGSVTSTFHLLYALAEKGGA